METKDVDLTALMDERPLGGLQIKVAALCGLIAILDGIDTQSIAIAAPSIAESFGMKVTAFGPVFAIALLGGVIGAVICGSLSDALGRKRVLIGATLTFAAFTILTAFAGSYQSLLATRFAAGLGLGGAVPCFLALASDYAPTRRRGTLASLLWAGFPLGGMLGGFINAYLVAHFGWPTMFYVGGVLPILVALVLVAALPESPTFLAARDNGSPQLLAIAGSIAGRAFPPGTRFYTTEKKVQGMPARHLLTAGRAPATLLLWLPFFLAFGLLGLVVLWTPAILQGAGIPASGTATVLGFHGLGALIGMGVAGRVVDRFGPSLTLAPAFVVAAGCTVLLGSIDSMGAAALVMALIGLFLGLGASGLIALASSIYPTTMRSTGIGWAMGIGRLGQVVGPLVTGSLMVHGLSPGQLMQFLGALPIIAAIAVLLLRTVSLGRSAAREGGETPSAVVG